MTAAVEGNKDQTFKQQFDELYRENRPILYRTAYRITGNHHDAEEALQDAYIKLKQRPRPTDLIKNPIGYLHQAVFNAARDTVRQQMRQKRTHVSNAECEQIPAPESVSKVDKRIEHLRVAVAKMKPKLVQILNLCCVEDLPCTEVAKILRKPLGTVYADLFRAKLQVRRLIRIQEKHDEAQKNQHQGILRSGLADPSAARG